MSKKSLNGFEFVAEDGLRYVVCVGYEGGSVAFAEVGNDGSPLRFCCDAKVENGRLSGSYNVTYAVSKKEFFETIDRCLLGEPVAVETALGVLKRNYLKIPTVFLEIVATMYMTEREVIQNV